MTLKQESKQYVPTTMRYWKFPKCAWKLTRKSSMTSMRKEEFIEFSARWEEKTVPGTISSSRKGSLVLLLKWTHSTKNTNWTSKLKWRWLSKLISTPSKKPSKNTTSKYKPNKWYSKKRKSLDTKCPLKYWKRKK